MSNEEMKQPGIKEAREANELLLTREAIREVLKELKIHEPIWDSKEGCWVDGEFYQRYMAVAEAQLAKAQKYYTPLMEKEAQNE